MKLHKAASIAYFRNFIFGVEDSLVSTVGLLSGIAVAEANKETLIITGIVLILVEAVSMAAGSLLSEYSAESYATKTEALTRVDLVSSGIMFISYLISGLIPLMPYVFLPVSQAIWVSVIITMASLFILGIVGAKMARIHALKNAFRMLIVGGIAITVGMLAGKILELIS